MRRVFNFSLKSMLLIFILIALASCSRGEVMPFSQEDVVFSSDTPGIEPFVELINAYVQLELSGFTEFDERLIGHSYFAEIVRYSLLRAAMPWWWMTVNLEASPIMYALHDISGDGIPELFIGAEHGIAGIYTLRRGTPVSIAQAHWRTSLSLKTDIDGGYIIALPVPPWFDSGERVYALGENGDLNLLFTIMLYDWHLGVDGITRVKYVDGEGVGLTLEEHTALVRRYGLCGVMHSLGEEVLARGVGLEWRAVLTGRMD